MKKWTRLLAGMLGGLLMLSACSKGEENASSQIQTPKGQYIETDITPPGLTGMAKTFALEDGTLVCYSQDLKHRYETKDLGTNWQESKGPGGFLEDVGFLDFDLLPDGKTLLAVVGSGYDSPEQIVKITEDGEMTPFVVEDFPQDGSKVFVETLKAMPQNRLLLGYSIQPQEASQPQQDTSDSQFEGQVFFAGGESSYGLYDLDSGKRITSYQNWFGQTVCDDAERFYTLSPEGSIGARQLSDGSADPKVDLQVPLDPMSFLRSMQKVGEDFYIMDGKQVVRTNQTGTETVLAGGRYSFDTPSLMLQNMFVLPGGEIVLCMADMQSGRIYKYQWDENATTDPEKTIKVWSLNNDPLMLAAIGEMRRKNPGVTVEYEVGLDESRGMTAEDAIKQLNTRMLNQDGPDVIVLDGIPAEVYAQKGMLQDLRPLVDTKKLFPAFVEPFETSQGLYYLPGSFSIPLLLSDTGPVDSLSALLQQVQQGQDALPPVGYEQGMNGAPEEQRPVLQFNDLQEVYDLLWNTSASQILTPQGLNGQAVEEMLKALQTIHDKYKLSSQDQQHGSAAIAMIGGATNMVGGSPLAYSGTGAHMGAYTASDLSMLGMLSQRPNTQLSSFPGLVQGAYVPGTLVGINQETRKPDLAAQLLGILYGETVQGTITGTGFPVTQAGMEKQMASINDMMKEMGEKEIPVDYTHLVSLAKTPILQDQVVKNTIWQEAEKLCKGEIQLEGAVKEIEQSLKNYLAERK